MQKMKCCEQGPRSQYCNAVLVTHKEPFLKGRLSTADLLIKIANFVKEKFFFTVLRAADLD
jgi:hypothetical protein